MIEIGLKCDDKKITSLETKSFWVKNNPVDVIDEALKNLKKTYDLVNMVSISISGKKIDLDSIQFKEEPGKIYKISAFHYFEYKIKKEIEKQFQEAR